VITNIKRQQERNEDESRKATQKDKMS